MDVLLVLLIELAIFIPSELSLLTGMTTPSPARPKRENLGVGPLTDIQSSVGSHEIVRGRGWLDKLEADGRRPRGIG